MLAFSELKRRNVFRVGAAYLVTAWLIIQVAETLFPLFGFSETPARMVVIMLAIGFVPVLVCAWVFRLTPDGFRLESPAPTGEAQSADQAHAGGPLFDRVVIVVLAVTLSYFAFNQFVLDPQRDAASRVQQAAALESARLLGRTEAMRESSRENSIAVLPFRNTSNDPANEYFSDGISEELLNLLAQLPELRVISRTSAFSYKGRDVPLSQIAGELNVGHVLEGTVRRSADRVRVTAQLVDARSDTQLWSRTWDRTLGDIFAVQEEIATEVVDNLKLRLLAESPRVRQTDPQAYAMYLQARYLGRQGTAEGYAQAVELLQRALQADPTYTPAWDALAGNYINQANRGLRTAEDGFSLARAAAERALEIDAQFAPAFARLAWVAMLGDNDLAQSAAYYERAVQLAPGNDRIIGDAALLLRSLGRFEECIMLDEYVVSRDPVNTTGFYNLAGSYFFAGRTDAALEAWQTALRLSPGRTGAHFQIGIARLLDGDSGAALAEFEREPLEVLRWLGLAMAHHALGQAAQSAGVLADLIGKYQRDAAYNIAYVEAFRGQFDAAFVWLEQAIEQRDPGLSDLAVEPLFAALRSDPRWLPLLTRLGKAPSQRAAIRFTVTLPSVAAQSEP